MKTYMIKHFYQQYLVLLTMAPRNIVKRLDSPLLLLCYCIRCFSHTSKRGHSNHARCAGKNIQHTIPRAHSFRYYYGGP